MTVDKNMYIRSTGGSLVTIPVNEPHNVCAASGSGKTGQPMKDVKNRVSKKARPGQR